MWLLIPALDTCCWHNTTDTIDVINNLYKIHLISCDKGGPKCAKRIEQNVMHKIWPRYGIMSCKYLSANLGAKSYISLCSICHVFYVVRWIKIKEATLREHFDTIEYTLLANVLMCSRVSTCLYRVAKIAFKKALISWIYFWTICSWRKTVFYIMHHQTASMRMKSWEN